MTETIPNWSNKTVSYWGKHKKVNDCNKTN